MIEGVSGFVEDSFEVAEYLFRLLRYASFYKSTGLGVETQLTTCYEHVVEFYSLAVGTNGCRSIGCANYFLHISSL